MKKRLKLFLIALTTGLSALQINAQTNTFPTTGNAGIGTTSPTNGLSIIYSENQTTLGSNDSASIRISNSYTTSVGRRTELQFGLGPAATDLLCVIASEYKATGGTNQYTGDLLFATSLNSSLSEKMRITNAGNVGIGITSPSTRLHVVGDGVTLRRYANGQHILLERFNGASESSPAIVSNGNIVGLISGRGFDGTNYLNLARLSMEVDGTPGTADMPGRMVFLTTPDGTIDPVERMRITNAGNIGIGTTSPNAILHTTVDGNGAIFNRFAGDADLYLNRANGTLASPTIVANNDVIGSLMGKGYSGSTYQPAARIQYEIDGTPGSGTDMPGRITFATTTDGTATLTERMRIANNGNVAIGTTNTSVYKLNVVGSSVVFQNFANDCLIGLRRANGTEASPTIVASQDVTGRLNSVAYDGTTYRSVGSIAFGVDGTPGASDMPGRITFSTTPDGNTALSERMRITNAGTIGIGTTSPSTKLHVVENLTGVYAMTLENSHTTGSGLLIKAGGAGSSMNLLTVTDNAGGEILKLRGADQTLYVRELEVRIGAFPDYVFEKNYPLLPLSDLETYIQKNKHLPNVPSAQEVEENGANVGNLVKVQMEKIEELTLYLIEMKKQNDETAKQNSEMKKENEEIKKENAEIKKLLLEIKNK